MLFHGLPGSPNGQWYESLTDYVYSNGTTLVHAVPKVWQVARPFAAISVFGSPSSDSSSVGVFDHAADFVYIFASALALCGQRRITPVSNPQI